VPLNRNISDRKRFNGSRSGGLNYLRLTLTERLYIEYIGKAIGKT